MFKIVLRIIFYMEGDVSKVVPYFTGIILKHFLEILQDFIKIVFVAWNTSAG